MYKGYNLDIFFNQNEINEYHEVGLSIYEADRKLVRESLEKYKNKDNTIDGSKLQASWFPSVKSHVFLSHSHKDKDSTALTLAGWLYKKLKIKSFIDSCIWGYAGNLLQMIDNTYCWSDSKKETYNYTKRNYSTSHVYMMLSIALSSMIEQTECLIFLNTPNSITPDDEIDKTLSPWIYSEIAMSKIIRTRTISEYRKTQLKTFSKGLNEDISDSLAVKYDVDLSHLIKMDKKSFNNWVTLKRYDNAHDALDTLYHLNS